MGAANRAGTADFGIYSRTTIDHLREMTAAARTANPTARIGLSRFVAAGTGRYRVADGVTSVGPGDLLFCAAHVPHGFENISENFSVWVLFYGPVRQSP